jgi:hypothetical protein
MSKTASETKKKPETKTEVIPKKAFKDMTSQEKIQTKVEELTNVITTEAEKKGKGENYQIAYGAVKPAVLGFEKGTSSLDHKKIGNNMLDLSRVPEPVEIENEKDAKPAEIQENANANAKAFRQFADDYKKVLLQISRKHLELEVKARSFEKVVKSGETEEKNE